MSRHQSLAFLALVALIAGSNPTLAVGKPARDPDRPPIDPLGNWHIMTRDPATTTSQCIGEPKTALCAIETMFACYLRAENNLCRIGMDDPTLPELIRRGGSRTEFWKYRVVSEKKSRIEMADGTTPDGKQRLVTYTWLHVGIMWTSCWAANQPAEKPVCVGHQKPTTYNVLKLPDRWKVTGWDTPRY